MKKIIPIALLLVFAVGLLIFSFSYRNRVNSNTEFKPLVTVTQSNNSDGTPTDDDLIAECKEGGYKLYYKDETAVLSYKDERLEFPSWNRSIEIEKPQLYYNDFDKDGEKELIVRVIDNFGYTEISDEYSYTLYMFKPVVTDGKEELKFITAQMSTWKNVFDNAIKFEVTQLKSCKKFIQFAMNDATANIDYDVETGITTNEYVSFARADSGEKKDYYTVAKYTKGLGIYNVTDNGDITLDIRIILSYKETTEAYYVGNIHCNMEINQGAFKIQANSISFIPLDEYKIPDPRDAATENWSTSVSNLSSSVGSSDVISKFDLSFNIGDGRSSAYLNTNNDDTGNIDRIDVVEKGIYIVARRGYSFDGAHISNGKYNVIVDGNDISYFARLGENNSGEKYLFIGFDKTYDKEDLPSIQINFGV